MKMAVTRPILLAILAIGTAEINALEPRIVGGTKAPPGAAPFQVSIRRPNGKHECGGTLISDEWILTAAHCMGYGRATKIVVGSNDLKKGGTTYEVEEAIVHEKYGSFSIYSFPINDIGLFRVNKIEINNSTVKPIKYSDKYIEADTVLQTFGWGKLTASKDYSPASQFLQMLNVVAISNEKCKIIQDGLFQSSYLCTTAPISKGICYGDSGGPLVLMDDSGEFPTLVGITSWTYPKCAASRPFGFTRISKYADWIKSKTGF